MLLRKRGAAFIYFMLLRKWQLFVYCIRELKFLLERIHLRVVFCLVLLKTIDLMTKVPDATINSHNKSHFVNITQVVVVCVTINRIFILKAYCHRKYHKEGTKKKNRSNHNATNFFKSNWI